MSGKSTIDQIKHYQKDIERCPDNAERMLRCIQRLYILPITLEHLQLTGVGRSVNGLRKYKGDVGEAAKALVTKWKAMVAAEDSVEEEEEEETVDDPEEAGEEITKSPPPSTKTVTKLTENRFPQHKSHEYDTKNKHHHEKTSKKSHISENVDNFKNKIHKSSSSSKNTEKENNHKDKHSNDNKKRKHESSNNENNNKKHKSSHKSYEKSSTNSKNKKMISSDESENSASELSDNKNDSDSDSGDIHQSNHESEDEVHSNDESNDSDNSNSSNDKSKHSKSSSHHQKHSHQHKSSSSHSKNNKESTENKHNSNSKNRELHNKNKENLGHNKHSSSSKNKKDYKDLIKENEKKIKKEKFDEFAKPSKSAPKNVKLEANDDGSIDSGSGASFADALLCMDSYGGGAKKSTSSKKQSSSSPRSQSDGVKKSSHHHSSSSSSRKSSSHHKSSSSKPLSDGPSSSSSVIKSEDKTSAQNKSSSHKSIASSSSSSSRPKTLEELVEPPDLLSKNVKLEALDLDISGTLPEINPNYKPLPHVPERAKLPRTMSAEDHMFNIMTTKNQRTKVYSGNKVILTSVPSLYSMCIQLLFENIDAVEYTGGVPYQILKPLLEKLNADQLYVLEHFNPYLIEDTDDLWKFHCSKEFRSQKRQDMESWRELYVRCMDEREKKLKALTANITQSMAKSTPVRQAKLAFVDSMVKPPRNIARKQAKFGTGSSSSSSAGSGGVNPKKQEIVTKAMVGANTPGVTVEDSVPTPRSVARSAAAHSSHSTPTLLKKKKAPLMQKALQVMKGTRYKR